MRYATLTMILGSCLLAADVSGAQTAEVPEEAFARIRIPDAALAALVREAAARSMTFHSIVDRIGRSDGIVYVEPGTCRRGLLHGCLVALTTAGANRVLRVRVDTRRSDADVMASVGHELWHATEVLGDSTVRDVPAMYFFFHREGHLLSHGFETTAAIRAGDRVRAEVRRSAAKSR